MITLTLLTALFFSGICSLIWSLTKFTVGVTWGIFKILFWVISIPFALIEIVLSGAAWLAGIFVVLSIIVGFMTKHCGVN